MKACSFVCIVALVFILIDQFYSGLNYFRLFIGGIIAIAVWTDCERLVRYKLRRKRAKSS